MALQVAHPYVGIDKIRPLKGNLHAHTNESDGTMQPQAMIDAYAERGYDFLMVSDHDIYNSPERLAGYQANGMTLIPGNEVTANGPHLLHVNANRRVEPQRDRQAGLDEIGRGGGFAIMNHPNWEEDFDHLPFQQLEALRGYAGIEIFNGVCQGLAGSAYATDKWDRLTGTGRRVWGFANDDLHAPDQIGRGWNMVYAASRHDRDLQPEAGPEARRSRREDRPDARTRATTGRPRGPSSAS